jgi:H/ACA ribonucleoprotein complex subunit 2
MAKDAELKEEKKKKRKSEVADLDVDAEAKKAKKEKRKSLAAEDGEKVCMPLQCWRCGSGILDPPRHDPSLHLLTLLPKAEFEVPLDAITPIAVPLAGKKLSKKVLKTVKRASKARQLKRGVKEVVKSLRKGEKGLLVLAANITPIDVISHLPVLAEDTQGVEYVWVTSK